MPAFGFPPSPAGPLTHLNPNPCTDHGFCFSPYPLEHQSPEAYEVHPPTEKHEYSSSYGTRYGYGDDHNGNTLNQGNDSHEQDYSSCFEQEGLFETPSDDTRYGSGNDHNDNTVKQGSPYCPCPFRYLPWKAYSSACSRYTTLAQNAVADSSHKPVTNSTELTQPQVHKASFDNHIEGSRGGSVKVQCALFPTPSAQWDEMAKTMTKASWSSVIGQPTAESSSTIKEDNILDSENANDASSKYPNLSIECELLLVSIYNMSTILKNKLSTFPNTEGHLDVNMLESTIGLLSRCLLKHSSDNSTKLTWKLSPQSQQSIQDPSSKADIPACPSAMLNKDTVPSAEGILSHEEIEHSLVEQQTVSSTKMEGSSHLPSTQVCDRMLSDGAEGSFDKSEEEGGVPERYSVMTDASSDAEDWEYIT